MILKTLSLLVASILSQNLSKLCPNTGGV